VPHLRPAGGAAVSLGPAALVRSVPDALGRTPADELVIVGVSNLAATAVVSAEAAGLGVLDAIAVANGRWRSYECTDVACCPPEGHPIGEGR
jgi:hypothetical protein